MKGNTKRTILAAVSAALFTATSLSTAHADDIADFYSGNEINVIVGYGPGGGYDAYARLLARYMGRYIPGEPLLVPENMPGGGSQMAAAFLHRAAPKDGTTMATFAPQVAVGNLIGEVPFDGRELVWVGSVTNRVNVCVFSQNSAVQSWEDMLTTDHILGGEGVGADVDAVSMLFMNVFNTRSQLITGYPGTAELMLALERGEVDGVCGMSWVSTQSRYGDLLESGQINVVVQASFEPGEGLDVPNVVDLVESDEQAQILAFLLAASTLGRPFATTPDTPPERVEALRRAFDQTLQDPEFLSEAERMRLEINPATGEELTAALEEIYQTPAHVIEKAMAAMR